MDPDPERQYELAAEFPEKLVEKDTSGPVAAVNTEKLDLNSIVSFASTNINENEESYSDYDDIDDYNDPVEEL